MAGETSFAAILQQLRQRDDRAASVVFARFSRRLVGLARQHLDGRLRQKVDPEDIVQSVFGTLFRHLRAGDFDLGGWDSLWGLLTTITVRKCGKWVDYYTGQRRDLRREVSLEPAGDGSTPGLEIFDREPTPSEAASLAETVEGMLRGLNERERQIVLQLLQGACAEETGRLVGCSERKVRRVLHRVRERLERLRDQPEGPPRLP